MSRPNTRKRPAPGSMPAAQQPLVQQQVPQSSSTSSLNDQQFMQWGQAPIDNTSISYGDPNAIFDPSTYHSIANQAQASSNAQLSANQIARRPAGQQLVANNLKPYGDTGEVDWMDYGDNGQPEVPPGEEWMNDEEEVERRAQVAKRDAQTKRRQIPPFIQKLKSFVDKEKNHHLIRWSKGGDSFIVLDEDEFAKTLIPELFKHNNYASFVRQLNMYGFHKKVGLSDNSMKASERKNKTPNEYAHPFFKRGKPDYLWLISKPRNTAGRGKKGQTKTEDGADKGSDDDDRYGDEGLLQDSGYQKVPIQGQGTGTVGSRRLITSGPGGALQKQEMTEVQRQLQEVRSQQRLISMTLNRLRKDHDTLLENVITFQDKHNRHENSINAILTFLATVYNRSGEGHGLQNMANMFTNAIPQDVQNQGNVVDVGDYSEQTPTESTQRRFPKRQPLLLGPPTAINGQVGRASTLSPGTSASSPQLNRYTPRDTNQSGTVEELANSPQPDSSLDSSSNDQYPNLSERDIMRVINSTNNSATATPSNAYRFDFPAALEHSQSASGGPLSAQQREQFAQMVAQGSNGSNALTSPNAPPVDLSQLRDRKIELDRLSQMQAEMDNRVQTLTDMITPLSPNGSIPGLHEGQLPEHLKSVDLDQMFNEDYFSNYNLDNGGIDDGLKFDYDDPLGSNAGGGANDSNHANFDSKAQTNLNDDSGRIVEQVDSSAGTTPAGPGAEMADLPEDGGSPSKRRKNTKG